MNDQEIAHTADVSHMVEPIKIHQMADQSQSVIMNPGAFDAGI